MYLFFTSPEGMQLPDGSIITREDMADAGFPERLPFFVDRHGRLVEDLTAFFFHLASERESPHTWAAYAYDIHAYIRWLTQRWAGMRSWRVADANDLLEYRRFRINPAGRNPLSHKSWNRHAAAIGSLYRWAHRNGLIGSLPFTRELKKGWDSEGHMHEAAKSDLTLSPNTAHYRPEWLTWPQFRVFRDLGLASEQGKRGRHAARNQAAAHLMLESGVRASETVLLLWEIPTEETLNQYRERGERTLDFKVAQGIAKGHRARRTIMSVGGWRLIRDYIRIDRVARVRRYTSFKTGEYRAIANPLRVERIVRNGLPTDEFREIGTKNNRKIASVSVAERVRMIEFHPGKGWQPVAVFLNDWGVPMNGKSWIKVFKRACLYCELEGRLDVAHVTPHVLRHSFAVNMLEIVERTRLDKETPPGVLSELLPLSGVALVQRCLGHTNPLTTLIYTHEVQERIMGGAEAIDAFHAMLEQEDG